MKFFGLFMALCVLAAFPLAAAGGQQSGGTASNSADIVTPAGQLPIVKSPITLVNGRTTSANVNDYNTAYLTRYLQEKTGIKLEFQLYSSTDATTQFELMVSSNEKLPDILSITPPNWNVHGDNGVFLDLNPLIDKYGYYYQQRMKQVGPTEASRIAIYGTAPSGKRYGWMTWESNAVNFYQGHNSINRTWLNNLGLQMPTTTEQFYNTMIAFRDRDPNKNGQKDEIPWISSVRGITGAYPMEFIINAFVYYPYRGSADIQLNVTNGKLWTSWTTDEYREALRFLNRLYNEGIVTPGFFTMIQAEITPITSYQAGQTCRVGFISGHPNQLFVPETPAVNDYMNQVSLIGPKGVNNYPMVPPSLGIASFITKDCKYPEAAFRLLDFNYDADTTMVSRFVEKDVDWRWVNVNEGLMSPLGFPATFQELNMIWGVPNTKHWSGHLGIFMTDSTDRKVKEVGTWNGKRWEIYERLGINDGKDAKEQVYKIIYTQQEDDQIREIRSSISTYRDECLALFVTGDMSLDRDWNTYISTLERMGLPRYLQVAQTAYTRTLSIK